MGPPEPEAGSQLSVVAVRERRRAVAGVALVRARAARVVADVESGRLEAGLARVVDVDRAEQVGEPAVADREGVERGLDAAERPGGVEEARGREAVEPADELRRVCAQVRELRVRVRQRADRLAERTLGRSPRPPPAGRSRPWSGRRRSWAGPCLHPPWPAVPAAGSARPGRSTCPDGARSRRGRGSWARRRPRRRGTRAKKGPRRSATGIEAATSGSTSSSVERRFTKVVLAWRRKLGKLVDRVGQRLALAPDRAQGIRRVRR